MLWTALLLSAVVGFVALPNLLLAADTRSGSDITIPATDTITEDVYLSAGTVDFLGRADRDVSIAAAEATISGTIRGSLNMMVGTATVSGPVAGSLRIVGGTVEISGNIGGDVVVAGGRLQVTSTGRINGNILMAGGQLEMDGQVSGDVQGYVGSSHLGGTVTGDVNLWTSNLQIASTARITGDVTVTGQQGGNVDEGAQITGIVSHQSLSPWGGGEHPLGRASSNLLRTLWMLVTGSLLIVLAPRLAQQLGSNGRRLVPALPLGLLATIAIPIIAAALMVTVVGLPAGIVLLMLFGMSLYITQVVVGMTIGRFVLPRSWNDGSRGFHLLAMTIGVIFLATFRFVPLPWVWALVSAVVTIWGIGAILMLIPLLSRREAPRTLELQRPAS